MVYPLKASDIFQDQIPAHKNSGDTPIIKFCMLTCHFPRKKLKQRSKRIVKKMLKQQGIKVKRENWHERVTLNVTNFKITFLINLTDFEQN